MTISKSTILPRAERISKNIMLNVVEIELDAEQYETGGIALDYNHYVPDILAVNIPSQNGYSFQYDEVNKKIKAYEAKATPVEEEDVSAVTNNRIYHGAVTGGPFQVGETITGAPSTATAIITAVGSGYLNIGTITGTFATAETITGGTSTATASTTTTTLDVWELANTPASVQNILENTDTMLDILSPSVTLATGDARVHLADNEIETLLSDAYTALKVTYAKEAAIMAEVANATALTMTLKATIIGLEG